LEKERGLWEAMANGAHEEQVHTISHKLEELTLTTTLTKLDMEATKLFQEHEKPILGFGTSVPLRRMTPSPPRQRIDILDSKGGSRGSSRGRSPESQLKPGSRAKYRPMTREMAREGSGSGEGLRMGRRSSIDSLIPEEGLREEEEEEEEDEVVSRREDEEFFSPVLIPT